MFYKKLQLKFAIPLLIVVLLIMLLPLVASAQLSSGLLGNVNTALQKAGGGAYSTTQVAPESIVQNIINYVLGFLMLAAIIIILIGGFNWMTAGGNDQKVESGKKWLINGIIGLIIILAAYVLVNFAFNFWFSVAK